MATDLEVPPVYYCPNYLDLGPASPKPLHLHARKRRWGEVECSGFRRSGEKALHRCNLRATFWNGVEYCSKTSMRPSNVLTQLLGMWDSPDWNADGTYDGQGSGHTMWGTVSYPRLSGTRPTASPATPMVAAPRTVTATGRPKSPEGMHRAAFRQERQFLELHKSGGRSAAEWAGSNQGACGLILQEGRQSQTQFTALSCCRGRERRGSAMRQTEQGLVSELTSDS
eukprot:501010-Rhodomonas_salina.3